jgi:hypothetical protein
MGNRTEHPRERWNDLIARKLRRRPLGAGPGRKDVPTVTSGVSIDDK